MCHAWKLLSDSRKRVTVVRPSEEEPWGDAGARGASYAHATIRRRVRFVILELRGARFCVRKKGRERVSRDVVERRVTRRRRRRSAPRAPGLKC
ncbi:hypothetical protein EVAR_51777_1 [Eumeta japonica]|uniref:Uncharacterized protein n=1 Tax=Eumeta variegata TaxID=151549 RepID=A0A4C1XAY0_EUMVA|nr:hypothetical protein EVAR_51777_1 [Eumeta japonica]